MARGIVADVLSPGDAGKQVDAALRGADVIVDMSASVAVARHLARDIKATARRVSLFLNPRGTEAVLLAEDETRAIPLDALEMQYYRALIRRPEFAHHLSRPGEAIRYGGSCRDVSAALPQELVALHAALGSRGVRAAVDRPGATIVVWQAETEGLGVREVRIEPADTIVHREGAWTLYTDRHLLHTIADLRRSKLPNETGGILIGAIDTLRRIVYVVDTIPSPPDSTEWPAVYIRGCAGLTSAVHEITVATDGALEYVGEWHSHPDGYGCVPSAADREAFAWLTDERRRDGLPPLMLIAGDRNRYGWYLGNIPEGQGG